MWLTNNEPERMVLYNTGKTCGTNWWIWFGLDKPTHVRLLFSTTRGRKRESKNNETANPPRQNSIKVLFIFPQIYLIFLDLVLETCSCIWFFFLFLRLWARAKLELQLSFSFFSLFWEGFRGIWSKKLQLIRACLLIIV